MIFDFHLQTSAGFPVLSKRVHPPGLTSSLNLPAPAHLPAASPASSNSPFPTALSNPPTLVWREYGTQLPLAWHQALVWAVPLPFTSLTGKILTIQLSHLFSEVFFPSPPLCEFYLLKLSHKTLPIPLICPLLFWTISVSGFIWVSLLYSSMLLTWDPHCLELGLVSRSVWCRLTEGTPHPSPEWRDVCIPSPTGQSGISNSSLQIRCKVLFWDNIAQIYLWEDTDIEIWVPGSWVKEHGTPRRGCA